MTSFTCWVDGHQPIRVRRFVHLRRPTRARCLRCGQLLRPSWAPDFGWRAGVAYVAVGLALGFVAAGGWWGG